MGCCGVRSSVRGFRRHDPYLVAETLRQRLAIAMGDLERFPEAQRHVDRADRQKAKEMGAERHVPYHATEGRSARPSGKPSRPE